MSQSVRAPFAARAARLLAVVSVAALLAACSTDSSRFQPQPWSSAQAQHDQTYGGGARQPSSDFTGSIPDRAPPPPPEAPRTVQSSSLPPLPGNRPSPVAAAPAAPMAAAPAPAPTAQRATPPRSEWQAGPAAAGQPAPSRMPQASRAPAPIAQAPAPVAPAPAPMAAAPAPVRAPAPVAQAPVAPSGGSVIVEEGDSLLGIARRNGVTTTQLMQANNIQDANDIRIGQRLVVPGRTTPVAAAPRPAAAPAPQPVASAPVAPRPLAQQQPAPTQAVAQAPAPAPVAATPRVVQARPADGSPTYTVRSGDTLNGIARTHRVPVADLARANHFGPSDRVQIGQTLVIPRAGQATTTVARAPDRAATASTASAPAPTQAAPARPAQPAPAAVAPAQPQRPAQAQAPAPAPAPQPARPAAQAPAPQPQTQRAERPAQQQAQAPAAPAPAAPREQPAPPRQQAAAQPEAPARAPAPAQAAAASAPAAAAALPEPQRMAAGSTEFRWPVRGRVTQNFGRQNDGSQSDGIAIAVPSGTQVKAAENGVVVYAGNELRGYGNLVLVRHDNDFVTAYAHNGELLVRRGETVRRGQAIARSGQSGSAQQPQLHFEIRRGSTPVDPQRHLTGS